MTSIIQIKYYLYLFKVIKIADFFHFNMERLRLRKKNKAFLLKNPEVILPPDFYLYETFNLNYETFYSNSRSTTKWIINHVSKYQSLTHRRILDWGCGPGRILNHLPSTVCRTNQLFGTDYNRRYIKWCKEHLANVIVKENDLKPPLAFESSYFDVVYGISVFTHLSEKMHMAWMEELARVLKNNGILFLTLHGDVFKKQLTRKEVELYATGNLVIRKYEIEGGRLFGAYHPSPYVKRLASTYNFKVLEHIQGKESQNKPQQDVWILKYSNKIC